MKKRRWMAHKNLFNLLLFLTSSSKLKSMLIILPRPREVYGCSNYETLGFKETVTRSYIVKK